MTFKRIYDDLISYLTDAERRLKLHLTMPELEALINVHRGVVHPGEGDTMEGAEDLTSLWEDEFREEIPERFLERRSALGSAPGGEAIYGVCTMKSGGDAVHIQTLEFLDVVEMGGLEGIWEGKNHALTPPLTLRPQEDLYLTALTSSLLKTSDVDDGVYTVLWGLKRYGRVFEMLDASSGTPPVVKRATALYDIPLQELHLSPEAMQRFYLHGRRFNPHICGYFGGVLEEHGVVSMGVEQVLLRFFLPRYLTTLSVIEGLPEDELFLGMGGGELQGRASHVMEALRRSLPLPKIFISVRWDPIYIQKLWKIVKLMKRFREVNEGGWLFTTSQVGLVRKAFRFTVPPSVVAGWTGLETEDLLREMRRFAVGYRLNLPHEALPLLPPGVRTVILRGEGRERWYRAGEGVLEPVPMEGPPGVERRGGRWVRDDGLEVVEVLDPLQAPVGRDGGGLFFRADWGLDDYFPQ